MLFRDSFFLKGSFILASLEVGALLLSSVPLSGSFDGGSASFEVSLSGLGRAGKYDESLCATFRGGPCAVKGRLGKILGVDARFDREYIVGCEVFLRSTSVFVGVSFLGVVGGDVVGANMVVCDSFGILNSALSSDMSVVSVMGRSSVDSIRLLLASFLHGRGRDDPDFFVMA